MRKLIAMATIVVAGVSLGGTAFAGEVTGKGKTTPINNFGHAQSICAFSGLNDVPEGDLVPVDPEDPDGPQMIDPLSVGHTQNWGHTQALAKALLPPDVYAAARAQEMPGATCNGHTGIVAQVFGG